jgi:hypothetical protein
MKIQFSFIFYGLDFDTFIVGLIWQLGIRCKIKLVITQDIIRLSNSLVISVTPQRLRDVQSSYDRTILGPICTVQVKKNKVFIECLLLQRLSRIITTILISWYNFQSLCKDYWSTNVWL